MEEIERRLDAQEGQVAAIFTVLLAVIPTLSRVQLAEVAARIAIEQQVLEREDGDDTPALTASIRSRMLAEWLGMLEALMAAPG